MKRQIFLEYMAEWEEKLKTCQFVGEIYLDDEELMLLSRYLIKFRRDELIDRGQYINALVVLAVNCAYHYYDDQGFWVHFTGLLGITNTSSTIEPIGQAIERKLENLGLLKVRRSGPFRYVGAILEQCGVSRRYIPSLARIIRELQVSRDWDVILNMTHQEFQHEIEGMGCSRYLKSYLMDFEGWQFTGHVCHLLRCYEEGLMTVETLKEIPGFQPDFWPEFIEQFYEGSRARFKKSKTVSKPRLHFFPDRMCIGLVFPSQKHANGINLPVVTNAWKYPVTMLDRDELWSEIYSGKITDSDGDMLEWKIDGWIPDGLPVVFDIRKGLASRGSTLSPGEYYLLSPTEYDISFEIRRVFGSLKLPGDWHYKAYQIQLTAGDVLAGYKINEQKEVVELKWVEPEKHLFKFASSGFEIFTGHLPEIYVSDFSSIESNSIGMFYETDFGSGRIRTEDDMNHFRHECAQRAPVKGHIWLTRLSRGNKSGGWQSLPELEFVLIPVVNIIYEDRLYGFDDDVQVSTPDHRCTVKLDGCDVTEDGTLWIVPSSADTVDGIIKFDDLSVGVTIRVHRARVYNLDGTPLKYVSIKDLENTDNHVVISGNPDMVADVLVGKERDACFPIQFDENGFAPVRTEKLAEVFRGSNTELSEIFVRCGESTVSAGTVIFDIDALAKSIYSGKPCSVQSNWAKNLDGIINLCSQICCGNLSGGNINLNMVPRIHREIDEWLRVLFACSTVLDNTEILVADTPVDWVEQIENEQIKRILKLYGKEHLFTENPDIPELDLNFYPGVKRWKNILDNFFSNIKANIISWLYDWGQEVRECRLPFRSLIASQPGGNTLTLAWTRYTGRAGTEDVLSMLNNIGRPPVFVQNLGSFLHVLLLMRKGRFDSAMDPMPEKIHEELASVFLLLKTILLALSGKTETPGKLENLSVVKALPLREEDLRLFEVAATIDHEPEKNYKEYSKSDDWLLLLFMARKIENTEMRKNLLSRLISMKDMIPSSPEWDIMEDVKNI